MAEKKSWQKFCSQRREQYLELVSVFKEASRDASFIFIFKKLAFKFETRLLL